MRFLCTAAICLLLASGAHAQTLYWDETNFAAPHLRITDTNGGIDALFPLDPTTLPEGLAFDEVHHKIYWVEAALAGARILRADPNYTNVEVLVSGGSAFRGIALDVAGGKMYWTSSNLTEGGRIRRANLDGSNVQVLVDLGTTGSNPRGIALDLVAGKMYWADPGLNMIQSANLDGSSIGLVQAIAIPYGIAVDPAAGYLYWTNYFQGNIAREPIVGGPVIKLKIGLGNPTYLAIDSAGGRMFWLEAGAAGQKLRRSSLAQGGTIDDLPVTVNTYGGIAFSSQSLVDVPASEPVTQFALSPIAPNPVTENAQVEFALPHPAHVLLRAFDVRGREVARLIDGLRPAGRQNIAWPGARALDPGIYFLRLESPGVNLVRRFVLLI